MKKELIYTLLFSLFNFNVILSGCSKETPKEQQADDIKMKQHIDSALTKETQANLSIDEIINHFKEGNARFVKKMSIHEDIKHQVHQTGYEGQFPKAIVLSCIDSRSRGRICAQ